MANVAPAVRGSRCGGLGILLRDREREQTAQCRISPAQLQLLARIDCIRQASTHPKQAGKARPEIGGDAQRHACAVVERDGLQAPRVDVFVLHHRVDQLLGVGALARRDALREHGRDPILLRGVEHDHHVRALDHAPERVEYQPDALGRSARQERKIELRERHGPQQRESPFGVAGLVEPCAAQADMQRCS